MLTMAMSSCWASCAKSSTSYFRRCQGLATWYAVAVWKTLTLAFVFGAALRFRLKFRLDAVEQLIKALAWAGLGAAHDTRRVMVHVRNV